MVAKVTNARDSESSLSDPIQTLSIVIPTFGRPQQLISILQAIVPQLLPGDEIIVTDDQFTADASALITSRFPKVQVVKGPRKGPAANRNFGASKATGDWILFLDDDVLPDSGLVDAYRNGIRTKAADVCEGKTYSDSDFDPWQFEAPVNLGGGKLWSCNFAISRISFVELGGFNEAFHTAGGEDIEFHEYACSQNLKIAFLPNASVYHAPRKLPSVWKMAKRHHGAFVLRVLGGASPIAQLYEFPRHVLAYGVGQSTQITDRLRRIRWIFRSAIIAFLVLCRIPAWVLRDSRRVVAARRPVAS